MTVVFDGKEGGRSQESVAGFEVVFTSGETADEWISQKVRQATNPRVLTVVTDDQGIRLLIRGTGARWISTQEFQKGMIPRDTSRNEPGEPSEDETITDEFKKKWL